MLEKYNFLKERFNNVKALGYIICEYHDLGGPGRMLEKLLINKRPDNSRKADFDGIELKTICDNSKYRLTLFSLIPNVGNYDFKEKMQYFLNFSNVSCESNYINKSKTTIAMPHFYLSLFGKRVSYLNSIYKFYLSFDDEKKVVYLNWKNISTGYEEKNIYWEYSKIISTFIIKLKYLSLIRYSKYLKDDFIFCKYHSIEFYENVDENLIIDLLKKGIISISFNICSRYDDIGNLLSYYHGIRFEIDIKNLGFLYKKI